MIKENFAQKTTIYKFRLCHNFKMIDQQYFLMYYEIYPKTVNQTFGLDNLI